MHNNRFIKTIVYGSILISVAGLCQVIITQQLFNIPFNYRSLSYQVFVLLSTFLQYNMQRGYSLIHNQYNSERYQWLLIHKKQMMIAMGVCLIAVLFLCNWLSWTSIIIMIAAELISTLYYLKPFNLRKYGYFKPFLIGLIWVITCTVVPLIEENLLHNNAWYFIIAQFLLVSVLCIVFDIKDIVCDMQDGIKTYANTLGIKFTKSISVIIALVYYLLVYLFNDNVFLNLTNGLFTLLLITAIVFAQDKRHSFYYYVFVDSLLILQLMIIAYLI